MKIPYLYAEVMGYTMATIRELVSQGAQVHVVHWDSKKVRPYQLEPTDNVWFYGRSSHSTAKIRELAFRVNPDLVVISGWQDRGYLEVAKLLRKKRIPVVTGFDDQWHGSYRQKVASLLSFYLKRFFSHAWVSGPYQFEFARRLGFKKNEIVFNLYSADIMLFNDAYNKAQHTKRSNYPHRFLFVGRLEKIKGVDLLVETWNSLADKRKDWELLIIGSGFLKNYLQTKTGIIVRDFMQPKQLMNEISTAGCFILPSRSEPWGVVIHEFAAAGLPIICSDVCGAASEFIIHGFNGFKFESHDKDSLSRQILNIINADDRELSRMSECSHQLAQRITPALSAASLVSILKQER